MKTAAARASEIHGSSDRLLRSNWFIMQGQNPQKHLERDSRGPMILWMEKNFSAAASSPSNRLSLIFSFNMAVVPLWQWSWWEITLQAKSMSATKQLACADVGLNSLKYHLEQDSSQQKVLQQIQELNKIHRGWHFLQLPLPAQLNARF